MLFYTSFWNTHHDRLDCHLCGREQERLSQVTFIHVRLYTIHIILKQIHYNKQENKKINALNWRERGSYYNLLQTSYKS